MKTALIVGMARSGIASAKLLARNAYKIIINDTRESIPGLYEALFGIEYEDALGKNPVDYLGRIDIMVLSPGVPMFLPYIQAARDKGIEVIGEIELGYRFSKGDFLCITGTNGKTTCTALLGDICMRAHERVFVLGNIGVPITEFAEQTREGDLIVAETAALQLEGNIDFHAHVAGVTNIVEDHMDRFKSMDYYTDVKSMILLNQDKNDYAVLNYDDEIVRGLNTRTNANVLYFSRKHKVERGVFLRDGTVVYRMGGETRELIKAKDIRIPGLHNLENAMLCAAMALAANIPEDAIVEGLKEFNGVEHRIEFVCEKKGVRYINDSKGTNPDSTIKAIEAMSGPTVLILGGYDKHSSFNTLFEVINKSGKIVNTVVLGETAKKILGAAKEANYDNVTLCEKGFKEAVDKASALANAGETVLLSPACASWDMFENFEQRGSMFKEIVMAYEG